MNTETTETLVTVLETSATVPQIKAALLFTGVRDIRSYLNGLCIEHGPRGVRMIATDGHRVFIANMGESGSSEKPVRYVIERRVLEAAVKMVGKNESVSIQWVQTMRPDPQRPGVVIVECAKITAAGIPTTDVQDKFGRFPDYERVIPASTTGEIAQLNARYLADAAKAKYLLNGGSGVEGFIYVHHNGNGPAFVELCADAFAIVMPCLSDKPDEMQLPEWYTGKVEEEAANAA